MVLQGAGQQLQALPARARVPPSPLHPAHNQGSPCTHQICVLPAPASVEGEEGGEEQVGIILFTYPKYRGLRPQCAAEPVAQAFI